MFPPEYPTRIASLIVPFVDGAIESIPFETVECGPRVLDTYIDDKYALSAGSNISISAGDANTSDDEQTTIKKHVGLGASDGDAAGKLHSRLLSTAPERTMRATNSTARLKARPIDPADNLLVARVGIE